LGALVLRGALPVLAALALAGGGARAAAAATVTQLTLTMSDGTALACSTTQPDTPAATPRPGVILFHGLGQTHADMEPLAAQLADVGYETLECDARGTGGSGGFFGLDGPRDVQDARDEFDWLAGRLGTTQIGAVGLSLGGGVVWNAAAAGVPFKAIVPAVTWTNLTAALTPRGVPRTALIRQLAQVVPADRWDPQLAAARDALLGGTVTSAVTAAAKVRSVAQALPRLDVPTLLLQGRHDFLFDIDQALAAYRQLQGPKKLYLGDLGHPPAPNPQAERLTYLGLVVDWLDHYVQGRPPTPTGGVVLAHDPWDGATTHYSGLPPTRSVSVALPGATTLRSGGHVSRRIRLTGAAHETFGDGTVVVRYTGAKDWSQLVAAVTVAGQAAPVTVGAVPISKPAGVATIHLLDESVLLPPGKRLTVTVAATSAAGLYAQTAPPGAAITIGRETLKLSLLRRPVSR
jgi:alpha-beta hydrolase superfamily lysophospholipase